MQSYPVFFSSPETDPSLAFFQALSYQSENIEELPMNRLRTLSNSKWDDPFFLPGANKALVSKVEEMVEENENKYEQSGLESCLKTRPSCFFEFFNNYESEIPTNKEPIEAEEQMEDD